MLRREIDAQDYELSRPGRKDVRKSGKLNEQCQSAKPGGTESVEP